MLNVPFDLAIELADATMAKGFQVYQKFTCTHCGSRQTMDVPNILYTEGTCGECGKLSDITECGFMVSKAIL